MMIEESPTLEVFKRIVENVAELFRKERKRSDYTLTN